jgi:hypothetical protein
VWGHSWQTRLKDKLGTWKHLQNINWELFKETFMILWWDYFMRLDKLGALGSTTVENILKNRSETFEGSMCEDILGNHNEI